MGHLSVPKRNTNCLQQETWNHSKSVIRPVQESLRIKKEEDDELAVAEDVSSKDAKKLAKQLEKEMIEAVRKLEFEKAALLRDQISFLRGEEGERKLQQISWRLQQEEIW